MSDLLRHGFDPKTIMNDLIRINREVWGGLTESEYIWTEEMLRSQFALCPEFIFCAFENGKMVGTASGFLTNDVDLARYKTWLEKTAHGFFTHHDPKGDIGFGADLSVLKEATPQVSKRLMIALLFCGVIGQGVKALYLGSRIPSYRKNQQMSVSDYVYGKRSSGKPIDPELYFYLKDGFHIVEIIPEYMDDPDSLNYGVLIRWDNPFYRITAVLPFLKSMIGFISKLLYIRVPKTGFLNYD